jgi:undecaprenyl diphosphate synthase
MAGELTHIGFICDGNRRWARAQNLPTLEGHKRGFDKVEVIIDALKDTEVQFLSFFLFSTENWDRSPEEIAYLMDLVEKKIDDLTKKAMKDNMRVVVMGRPEPVKPKLWQKIMNSEAETAENTGKTICICFNYGGKWEIADAATKAIAAGETELTPKTFEKYLYHPEVPACDLIIRTSGEERISGFQLWRAAYAEFLFIDKHFPAIEAEDCQKFLDEFHNRQRRFGK